MAREDEWPRIKREKDFAKVAPDCIMRSERELVGPLRSSTARAGANQDEIGPRGVRVGGESRVTDLGMDRVSPREVDPIGTSSARGTQRRPPVSLVAEKNRP